jgi:hypothetical protein
MQDTRINILQFIIGLFTFLLGSIIYVLHRVYQTTYYDISFGIFYMHCGNYVPDFIHPFSFILLTCSFISNSLINIIMISSGWLIFDLLMEFGQKHAESIIIFIFKYFEMNPFHNILINYFSNGRYDPFDMIAISLGSLLGFLIAYLTKI